MVTSMQDVGPGEPEGAARTGRGADGTNGSDWNPSQYLRFADERTRPFRDLLAQVRLSSASRIVDLGCGPGNGTPALRARWPEAWIEGVDSSPGMIARATADNTDARVSYRVGDLVEWRAVGAGAGAGARAGASGDVAGPESVPVDLLVSNATLQWVPAHRAVLPVLADQVGPGGAFAFQVPGNFRAPAHVLLAELATSGPYGEYRPSTTDRASFDPAVYLEDLSRPGWSVDAWETTYSHVLTGEDPVFEFIAGTHARPVIDALPDGLRERFVGEYRALLRDAFPITAQGTTIMPFRRVFVVASRV